MKKVTVFALFLLLVGHTIFGPLTVIQASDVDTVPFTVSEKEAISGDGLKEGSAVTLAYKWNLNRLVEENQMITLPFPQGVTASQTTGTVQSEGASITYTITGSVLRATITKGVGPQSGTFLIPAKMKDGATNFTFAGQTTPVQVKEKNESSQMGGTTGKGNELESVQNTGENDSIEDITDSSENGNSAGKDEGNSSDTSSGESSTEGDGSTQDKSEAPVPNENTGDSIDGDTGNLEQGEKDETEGEKQTSGDSKEPDNESDAGEGVFEEEIDDDEKPAIPEEDAEPGRIVKENILTGASLNFEKEDGTETEVVDRNTLIGLTYRWALENGHGYKAGAVFTFKLPSELKIHNTVNSVGMLFNDEVIGYLTIAMDGTATITFTELIEEYSNINGTVQVWTEIREDTVITENVLIITPIEGKESIKIPIVFHQSGPAIEKRGIPNRTYNGDTVTWMIDVNKSVEKLTGAKIVDTIEEGQELKEGSMKLYKLKTKWNGTVEVGEEISIGEQSFPLVLGSIDSAYRLVYETEITDLDKTVFSNTGTLQAEDKNDASATASVTIRRGKPLEKQAKNYNGAEQSIEWEIRYNYNEKKISKDNAVLNDFFTNSHELIQGSIAVKEININPETGKEVGAASFTAFTVVEQSKEGKNGFKLSFEQDVEKAYKITYKTKAVDRIYDNGEVKNLVASGIHQTGDIGQSIGPQILFKSHSKPDYAKKEIGWTIRANSDRHEMSQVSIQDAFTNAGLSYKSGTIRVTEGGKEVEEFDFTPNSGGFTLTFNHVIKEEILITYTTQFDYEARTDKKLNYLENKADMTWKDTSGMTRKLSAKAAFKPDGYTQSNGFKNGSYNAVAKEITWNVGVNYNLQTLDKAEVEDEFDGNQSLLKESLKVYKMALTGGENGVKVGEAVEGRDYSISYPSKNRFVVVFNNRISEPYKIEYKTSVDRVDLVAKEYKNTATLLNEGAVQTNLKATVSTPYGGKYTEKSGVQNGMLIDWKVAVNFAESDVQNAKIFDQPDKHQALLPDTLVLYEAKVTGNGQVEKSRAMTEGTDYTVSFEEEPDSFNLKFKNTVSKPYILEYQTRIIAAVGTDINNDVTFSGDNIQGVKGSSQTFKVKRTNGMGNGTGELGGLTVVKVDAGTGNPLEGAKFTLLDPESKTAVATGVTDGKGELFFGRLLYGKYILNEVKAPNGYVGGTDQHITIDQPYERNNPDKQGNTITVKNKKVIGEVELVKYGENDETLQGAEFELQKETLLGYVIVDEKLITDEKGFIVKIGLEPGNYRFVETKAPASYQLLTSPVEFTIGDQDTVRHYVTATNLKKGSVLLKKVDGTDKEKTLPGAEFKLVDQYGHTIRGLFTTDENGQIVVKNLEPGTYQFIETKAPNHYRLNAQPIQFTLEPGKKDSIQVTAENMLIPRDVQLQKVDIDDESRHLQGATFELQKEDGSMISEHTTNDKGHFNVTNLSPGTYRFVETEAPEGYEIDSSPLVFTVEKSLVDPAPILKITKGNKAVPGEVIIKKVDKKTSEFLSGAEFRLEDTSGNVIKEKVVTDEKGLIEIKELAAKSYRLFETKAPKGYKRLTEPVVFTINIGQQAALELIVENEKSPTGGGISPPTDPEKPVNPPTDPEKPVNPPTDPEKPVNPPTDPEKPVNPPTDPEKPVNPPTDPEKPVNPPTDPEKPVNPSTDPEKPVNPPVVPEKPVNPVKPPGSPNHIGKLPTQSKPNNFYKPSSTSNAAVYSWKKKNQSKLPQTGESYPITMTVLGVTFILLGGGMLVRRKKKMRPE